MNGAPSAGSEAAWVLPAHESDWLPPDVDTSQPSVARVYDYALGGKNNFAVDRQLFQRITKVFPEYRAWALANRDFMARAVQFMAESGIRQFVDLGTGIPTSPNVHEVARQTHPDACVVYVDHDPIVVAHNRALLARSRGVVAVRHDLREPDRVLEDPKVRDAIDLRQPVGVLLIAVLHFVRHDIAPGVVARYCRALAPGSMVAISTVCLDPQGGRTEHLPEADAIAAEWSARIVLRTAAEIAELFGDLEMVQPGIVDVPRWRRDDTDTGFVYGLAGVGRVT
jgi:hypothetical protein